MKKIIHKAYWNYDKETAWLNELAAKGLSLSDYSWCRYAFEETEPGKYIYQIEFLEKFPGSPESQLYMRFLEDAGVEVVATYMKWVYLRKKAADGPFAIYSDNESKIKYLTRVRNFWFAMSMMELVIGLMNLGISVVEWIYSAQSAYIAIPWTNFFGGLICTVMGIVFFLTLFRPVQMQISRLKKDRALYD